MMASGRCRISLTEDGAQPAGRHCCGRGAGARSAFSSFAMRGGRFGLYPVPLSRMKRVADAELEAGTLERAEFGFREQAIAMSDTE